MDHTVAELLRGPKSEEPTEQIAWMRQVSTACARAPEKALHRIAAPLEEAVQVLSEASKGGEPALEAAEPKVAGLMLQAQGLALHGYLEELNRLRNAIAAEAARLRPGSEDRKSAEALQIAYEQTIDALARAYNGLREGKLEELKAIEPLLAKAREAAGALRKP